MCYFNFDKNVYLRALVILSLTTPDDVRWYDFLDKYNISPYDLILSLISKHFDIKEELDSLHHVYNELNSQNDDLIKKLIDLGVKYYE